MYRFNEMGLKIGNIILVANKMYYTLIYYPNPGSKNEMIKYIIIIIVLSQDSNVVFGRSKENKSSFCNTLIIIL